MKLTLSTVETAELLATAVQSIGLTDIDPSSVDVSIKSVRDGSGGSELTIECHKYRNNDVTSAPTPEVAEPAKTDDSASNDKSEPGSDESTSELDASVVPEESTGSLFS